jgi:biopolymer transport protein ExbD
MSMMIGARRSSPEINVTPLIDVLLVLLIIFMVVLPEHHLGESAQIPLPAPTDTAMNPPTPIVIQLKDAGEGMRPDLAINSQPVKWDNLESTLRAIYRGRENAVDLFVKGDPEVDFEYVAQALDISHHAGAERIGLLGKTD